MAIDDAVDGGKGSFVHEDGGSTFECERFLATNGHNIRDHASLSYGCDILSNFLWPYLDVMILQYLAKCSHGRDPYIFCKTALFSRLEKCKT